MPEEEEAAARVRVGRKCRVEKALLELGAELGIASQLGFRPGLEEVGLHVLLLLESGVERPPGEERVRRRRLEQVCGELGPGLGQRNDQRAARELLPTRREPCPERLEALPALVRRGPGAGGPEPGNP